MGYDISSIQMRNHSSTVLRGCVLTARGLPKRCSTLCLSEKFRLSGFRLQSSLSPSPKTYHIVNGVKEMRTHYVDRLYDRSVVLKGLGRDSKALLMWYSEMLKSCANGLCLNEGKVIHGYIFRSGVEPDLHLLISLINFYAKCGALELSRNIFDQMPVKDVVSWTAMISGFIAQGYGLEGVELFREMKINDVRPNEFTLATALNACAMISELELGKQLHAEVVKSGRLSDVYISSVLIDLYSKCGEMIYADSVFSLLPEKNLVTWNVLLNGHAEVGNGEAVLHLFCQMSEPEMRLNNYTLSIVLKGVSDSIDFRVGQAVHSIAIKVGSEFDNFVSCGLVNMYSKYGMEKDALKVFDRISDPDLVAWSAIISVLDQQGEKEVAAKLFSEMRCSGMKPNQFTLASIISTASDLGAPLYGKSIHACVCKFGFDYDDLVNNSLIAMYMKFRLTHDGCFVFNRMNNWDTVSWNALLSGFHDEKTSDQGIRVFKQMLVEGYRPNSYTFISTLRSCSSLLNVKFGKQVHSHIIKGNLVSDSFVGTALIDMYAKGECMDDVEVIFKRLNVKDVFTWTVRISGYSQANQGEKSISCFNQMRREGFTPNEYTFASCLSGSSGIASLENGRQLHAVAIKAGQSADVFVTSALIDMYGKCGYIDSAETLFNDAQSDDTVMWNTIICGYSQHGQDNKALETYRKMIKKEVLPDEVTFVGILSACSHLGLFEEGKWHFHTMQELFGISPCAEHYACMIDLLGRAGKFDEIGTLIEDMEISPNASVWENVLGACSAHGNVELGEKAAQNLFQIDPETDSNYILLYNIYSSRGRWDDASRVRAHMSNKGIKKEPGCSWVEIDAQVHVFLSQDVSHPRMRDIHWKLEELRQSIAIEGYIPNIGYVHRNVPDNEKKDNLSYHSERLALAFSLISNVKCGKIRIFKNLRICGDCHEFMKFVSKVINQEIIVRDTRRFHYFCHGSCSCKDYW